MKSVGEIMSFGGSFKESAQKALCSMEQDRAGFDLTAQGKSKEDLLELIETPTPSRIWYVAEALRAGASIEEVNSHTSIDLWFLNEIAEIIEEEKELAKKSLSELTKDEVLEIKEIGTSDKRIADLLNVSESDVREKRLSLDVRPCFKAVDTCAAEFVANTPYLYSTYQEKSDAPPTDKKKIIILGSGPNRIGQGIEFDYCCVHAVQALSDAGFEAIMINCNPETVSTDYDISDRLYFEPLTFESVMSIVDREKPWGVIVQFGGQTPLKLAKALKEAGVPIIGTSVESIDLAEDRELFNALVEKIDLKQPEGKTASSLEEAVAAAKEIGFPLMIRPSFVLGGRSMRIVFAEEDLIEYMQESVDVSNERPVLLDRYLHNAIEVDVDVVSDGQDYLVAGVMEHIERAGIHSGDSSCCLPPPTLSKEVVASLKDYSKKLAKELNVVGLMNVQYAVKNGNEIYIIEANPRASRTVPFVSKATGTPWAKVASLLMAGKTIKELGVTETDIEGYYAVKACVFPFSKFPGVDTILGPEMKSTGEVMGIYEDFPSAFAKSQFAAGNFLPPTGTAFLSVMEKDKPELAPIVKILSECNFKLIATSGTAKFINELGYKAVPINKVRDGSPHIVDLLETGGIDLVINTPEGSEPLLDSTSIRLVANEMTVPTFTTMAAASAVAKAIESLQGRQFIQVKALQDYL